MLASALHDFLQHDQSDTRVALKTPAAALGLAPWDSRLNRMNN